MKEIKLLEQLTGKKVKLKEASISPSGELTGLELRPYQKFVQKINDSFEGVFEPLEEDDLDSLVNESGEETVDVMMEWIDEVMQIRADGDDEFAETLVNKIEQIAQETGFDDLVEAYVYSGEDGLEIYLTFNNPDYEE